MAGVKEGNLVLRLRLHFGLRQSGPTDARGACAWMGYPAREWAKHQKTTVDSLMGARRRGELTY